MDQTTTVNSHKRKMSVLDRISTFLVRFPTNIDKILSDDVVPQEDFTPNQIRQIRESQSLNNVKNWIWHGKSVFLKFILR